MREVEIKKTSATDFEKIYPLLKEFHSPFTKHDWQHIFTYRWDGIENYVGFHLECHGNVVGFMGLIFSSRNKQGYSYKFCNITSLIIKKEYRTAALLLIRKIKQIENTIFTVLSPIYESYSLFTILGFLPIEKQYAIIPILYGKMKAGVNELPVLSDRLDAENKRIVRDHMEHKCQCMLIDCSGSLCLLIYKVTQRSYFKVNVKKIHILYLSDITQFNENLFGILGIFKVHFGWQSAIYLDQRFIDRKYVLPFIIRKTKLPKILMSNPHKDKIAVDMLYSEAILL